MNSYTCNISNISNHYKTFNDEYKNATEYNTDDSNSTSSTITSITVLDTSCFRTNKYKYRTFKFSKKSSIEDKPYENYSGGYVSEFDKNSPFIKMLITRRLVGTIVGPSCHIASFVPNLNRENKGQNWALGKMAIGENTERICFGNEHMTTHAEMDALKKLNNLFRVQKCKKQQMDLIVIRVNKSGNLCESAPCFHCTKELEKKKIVSINNLYFSRSDGSITCVKFSEWVNNKNLHVSKGWRWMNCSK